MVPRIAVVGVIFMAAAACASPTAQRTSSPPIAVSTSASQVKPSTDINPTADVDPSTEQRLWALANAAATSEQTTVKTAEAVRSTRSAAVLLTSQGIIADDQPVWLVQVEGTAEFVCDECSRPYGAAAPHGRFESLIVAASTFQALDSGLEATAADLSSLGTVIDLHP